MKAPACTRLAALMLLGALCPACKPMSEKEKAYFDARDAERRELQTVRDALTDSSLDSEVITMVKESAAPDGGTTEDWIKYTTTSAGGTVMFPEWTVSRRALNKFDVRFTFTLIDASNRITQSGFSWQVDTILRSVGPPREVTPNDSRGADRLQSPPGRKAISEKDLSLE
jgi:hypothetical protein